MKVVHFNLLSEDAGWVFRAECPPTERDALDEFKRWCEIRGARTWVFYKDSAFTCRADFDDQNAAFECKMRWV